jgi:hypothetical protein
LHAFCPPPVWPSAFAGTEFSPSTRAPECKSAEEGRVPGGGRALATIPDLSNRPEIIDARAQARCRIVAEVVEELVMLVGDRKALRRDRRRMMTHVRQIAMYVAHVILQVSLTDIGIVFGRDRTTVSYACHVVEDRRDDTDFDAFISAIERVVASLFGIEGATHA